MKTNNSLRGVLPDVAERNGLLYICYALGDNVFVQTYDLISGQINQVYSAFCQGMGFARIINHNGQIILLYRPNTGLEIIYYNLDTKETRGYNGYFYNQPAVFGLNGYAINNQDDKGVGVKQVQIFDYDGKMVQAIPMVPVTGIARLADDNQSVVSNNDNRTVELPAWLIYDPQYSDELFCGADQNGGVGVIANNSVKKILNPGTITYWPRIVKYGDRWAIVTGDYTVINIFYDISLADITGISPYDPKPEITAARDILNTILSKL